MNIAFDNKTLRRTIEKLIEEQNQTTWLEVYEKFSVNDNEEFFVLLKDEKKLRNYIEQFCQLIKPSVHDFRGYYKFLKMHPDR